MRYAILLVLLFQTPDAVELERHQGSWRVISFERDGKQTPTEIIDSIERIVEGDHVVWKRNGKSFAGTTMKLNPKAEPSTIDLAPDGGPDREKVVRGIYKFEGDTLTICTSDADKPRPKEFKAASGSGWTLIKFRKKGSGFGCRLFLTPSRNRRDLADGGFQGGEVNGLGEVEMEAGLTALSEVILRAVSRKGDAGDRSEDRVKPANQVVATAVGKPDIADDQVEGAFGLGGLRGGFHRVGGRNGIAF